MLTSHVAGCAGLIHNKPKHMHPLTYTHTHTHLYVPGYGQKAEMDLLVINESIFDTHGSNDAQDGGNIRISISKNVRIVTMECNSNE